MSRKEEIAHTDECKLDRLGPCSLDPKVVGPIIDELDGLLDELFDVRGREGRLRERIRIRFSRIGHIPERLRSKLHLALHL